MLAWCVKDRNSGAASCRQAAFHTTSALSVANANPLVADSGGRFDGHNFALKRGHEDRPSTFRCWPHVDDNGCNWPLLKHHAELCRTTPGLYAINLGDSSNNWTDRLIKLYAQQDWSVKTAPDDG
jgi:hypothetical protein